MSQPAVPPGVVVDCMVFVQATANTEGPAARILDLLDEQKITLYVSKLIWPRLVMFSVGLICEPDFTDSQTLP